MVDDVLSLPSGPFEASHLVERRLRAGSLGEADERSRAIASRMLAKGMVLIARSWSDSTVGVTMTIVFSHRDRPE
jgi:hypothetical protein